VTTFLRATCLLSLLLLAGVPRPALASQLQITFEEMAQTSDLIFIGTAGSQSARFNDTKTMIFTDVVFRDIQLIHATSKSVQRSASTVRVTYPGGELGGIGVEVSDTPRFIAGHRYLLFMSDDGQVYSTPMIGGAQGQFEVVKDVDTQAEYVLTSGGRAVLSLSPQGLVASTQRASAIQSGRVVAAPASWDTSLRTASAPQANDPSNSFRLSAPARDEGSPMLLKDLLRYTKEVALKTPLQERRLKQGEAGAFYRNDGEKMHVEELKFSSRPVRTLSEEEDSPQQQSSFLGVPYAPAQDSSHVTPRSGGYSIMGGQTGACGYQDLSLVMEQVPSNWWEFPINDQSMWVWNHFMDVYRYVDDDGSYGHNSENEFGGYPSSAALNSIYGYMWGSGTLAVTYSYYYPTCGRIIESDVFWNPAYSWTSDANYAIGNSGVVLQRPVTMHELGHTWGSQRVSYAETYDYDVATVMQPYYSNVVEDGWGIHVNDAYLIRRIYDDQTTIRPVQDIGVESYYGGNGLNNSWTNATTYTPGSSITLNNVLVENNGFFPAADVRIRFFLSTNRTISTGDRQMGGYWSWGSFCGECTNVGDYTMTIPSNTPPGTYYVGAIISVNGFGSDGFTQNNATSFYRTITVTCSGTYSVSPASRSMPKGGGANSVTVTSDGSACGFSASSNVSWLTITSGASGTGSGTINYSAAANTSTFSRSGHITVGGVTHTVSQPSSCLASANTSMTLKTPLNGTLSTADCLSPIRILTNNYRPFAKRYTFSGVAGQTVSLELTASFDTYMYLIGPGGNVVAQDDDGGSGLNSRIPATSGEFMLPTTGTYTVEITSYATNVTGSFTLNSTSTLPIGSGNVTAARF
jgi:hypothetical protein